MGHVGVGWGGVGHVGGGVGHVGVGWVEWGGVCHVRVRWGPLSVDMQPYGCFIIAIVVQILVFSLFTCFILKECTSILHIFSTWMGNTLK